MKRLSIKAIYDEIDQSGGAAFKVVVPHNSRKNEKTTVSLTKSDKKGGTYFNVQKIARRSIIKMSVGVDEYESEKPRAYKLAGKIL